MLQRLYVENYALIERLDIGFSPGLNIITGETGAGKSILLGALALILGGRAEAGALMQPDRNCVVEGEFDIEGYDLGDLFAEHDIDAQRVTVIRRVINPSGKSRAYINDIPVQLAVLKQFGDRLIDIHSQHQTLMVGDSRFQTGLLDAVCGHDALLGEYRTAYAAWCGARRALEALRARAAGNARNEEYIRFQYEQLAESHLAAGEQAELESERRELFHASEIKEALFGAVSSLGDDERSAIVLVREAEQALVRLGDNYPRAAEFAGRLGSVVVELKDIYGELGAEGDRIEADPERLEQVDRRLDLIFSLEQKHRVESVEELLSLQESYARQLAEIEGFDDELARLEGEMNGCEAECRKLAGRITAARRRAVPGVERYVGEMLASLGMPDARLEVGIAGAEPGPDGADQVRFLFSANRSGAMQPVERVASGGEMSRLMLSLKSLVAAYSRLPTVIFDEIDTGVSGRIADRMGAIMEDLARSLQIVNITHLPQVASKGDHHFLVYKDSSSGATRTHIRKLTMEERVEEIAKMLSGTDITAAAEEQARLLLGIGVR
ncbi:MAG: DNA repair protein RecN [Rikenellaceae bacterium]|nr:DNA repair protein RecN [Rikenellaceae bacterium]